MIYGYKNMEDIELARLSIANDKRALRELLLRIQKDTAIFIHYFDPHFIAENDLIQEILLKVTKNIKYLKTPQTIKKWSHKIIVNSYYDYVRKINVLKKRISYELPNKEEKITIIEDNHVKPGEEALNHELKDKIQGAVMKLHPNNRIVILLRDYAGLSYEDIESILGLNKGTVKSRLARARNKLKQELRRYL